jgi:hypothetical protein
MDALYLALAIPLGWALTGYALVSAPGRQKRRK